MTAAPYLALSGIGKRYGEQVVIGNLDLGVEQGEFVSLLGPSGCGKTTLLRIIAGLVESDAGSVRVAGVDLTGLPAHKRNIGVVFQNYALFPHLTVGDNVAFGLRAQRASAADTEKAVVHALDLVRLADYRSRPVTALSGGQQQRVALARAIATRPRLILLDEPLSALDRKLRETMQIELRRILRSEGMTAIFVTHDQEEALVMSDRLAVMNAGRIEQLGAPAQIYARPATPFVMDFVGLSCRLAGTVASAGDGTVRVRTDFGDIAAPGAFQPGAKVEVGIRPERVAVNTGGDLTGRNCIAARAQETVYLGSRGLLYFACTGNDRLLVEVGGEAAEAVRVAEAAGGETILDWRVEDTLLFPAPAGA